MNKKSPLLRRRKTIIRSDELGNGPFSRMMVFCYCVLNQYFSSQKMAQKEGEARYEVICLKS
ncbi:MAG: hypothetical protein QME06_04670 [Desulfobacterales bacterium]|nr:hypothetical protein [Desulfobacterales bacterium]